MINWLYVCIVNILKDKSGVDKIIVKKTLSTAEHQS